VTPAGLSDAIVNLIAVVTTAEDFWGGSSNDSPTRRARMQQVECGMPVQMRAASPVGGRSRPRFPGHVGGYQAEPVAYCSKVIVTRSRKARFARRRRRRMDSVDHDLSTEQWSALKEAWGGCAYCGATGKPLQRDCVQALSRGGRYTLDNIAPACGSCNASKCNDEVTGWMRRKKFDERGFLLRHAQIVADLTAR